MKTLLAHFYNHFEWLYLNPSYRLTDSSTDGNATVHAHLRVTGPLLSFSLTNDRGDLSHAIARTASPGPERWFRVSIVRQHLEGLEDETAISAADAANWLSDNLETIEGLFVDDVLARSCEQMSALMRASAERRFG